MAAGETEFDKRTKCVPRGLAASWPHTAGCPRDAENWRLAGTDGASSSGRRSSGQQGRRQQRQAAWVQAEQEQVAGFGEEHVEGLGSGRRKCTPTACTRSAGLHFTLASAGIARVAGLCPTALSPRLCATAVPAAACSSIPSTFFSLECYVYSVCVCV